MKKIGIVVAMTKEMYPFIESLSSVEKITLGVRTVYKFSIGENQLYMTQSGVGQIAAASATQFLIDKFEVDMILNFGLAGGLRKGFKACDCVIVERLVHYDFDTSQMDGTPVGRYLQYDDIYIYTDREMCNEISEKCGLEKVTCASGDKFVDLPENRRRLNTDFAADICEMESAAVLMTADFNKIPALIVKTISDMEEVSYIETAERACREFVSVINKVLDA